MVDREEFCSSYMNRYLDCLRINLPIFGNQHGFDMCNHINLILKFAKCPKQNMNQHIDKIKKKLDKK